MNIALKYSTLLLLLWYGSSIAAQTPTGWITIDYKNLVDSEELIQTGDPLGFAIQNLHNDKTLIKAIQPYTDTFSYLLQHSINMTTGPDPQPFVNVLDSYPSGSIQPAWAGILRKGKISIYSDNKKVIRIFLPGLNPLTAYKKHYSIIRHALNSLCRQNAPLLTLQTYSYIHNYSESQFILNPNPYIFRANKFATPNNKIELNINALQSQLTGKGSLHAFTIDKNNIILKMKSNSLISLAQHPIDISDLAICYRSVFHNENYAPFVSLDPHLDPTKVKVHLGGFLEDTHIGQVLIEADKIFKTISTGIDPNNFKDKRISIKKHIPSFLSTAERDLLSHNNDFANWIETRLWFYPDSIKIETSSNLQHAKIIKAQFTADAERNNSPSKSVSQSIQTNINHLNKHYNIYCQVFPQLQELSELARLYAFCIWLKKAPTKHLDLDSLLSVPLPAYKTKRELNQFISASYLTKYKAIISTQKTPNSCYNLYLGNILDMPFTSFFKDTSFLAKFLCTLNNKSPKYHDRFISSAKSLTNQYRNKNVRDFIHTKEQLKAFTNFATINSKISLPAEIQKLKNVIRTDKILLEKLQKQILSLTSSTTNLDYAQATLNNYEIILKRTNKNISLYNKLQLKTNYEMIITGGIDLSIDKFQFVTNPHFKSVITQKDISAQKKHHHTLKNDKLNRSLPQHLSPLKSSWQKVSQKQIKESRINTWHNNSQKYLFSDNTKTGSWSDIIIDINKKQKRYFNNQNQTMHIANYQNTKINEYIVAKKIANNKIVFKKASKKDVLYRLQPTPAK